MDAILTGKAEQLAREIASQATTLEELNGLLKLMMGSALERMLDTEMDVHLGRKHLAEAARDPLVTDVADPFADPPRNHVRRTVGMVVPKRPCRAILARS